MQMPMPMPMPMQMQMRREDSVRNTAETEWGEMQTVGVPDWEMLFLVEGRGSRKQSDVSLTTTVNVTNENGGEEDGMWVKSSDGLGR